jgi:hypothetical protein
MLDQLMIVLILSVVTAECVANDDDDDGDSNNRRWSSQYQQLQSTYLVNPKNNYPANTALANNHYTPSPSSSDGGVSYQLKLIFVLKLF